ncbi:malectin domain-containing carbohydrate-binding protein [Kineococcus sp. SYSU DK004]|uniref:malectin domain-containing carbohydrate-binding protein n=1 Tax=Kineococcus sp. SYSU DK004 TaxID=3383125 RepID=UPI003D7EFBF0
MRATTRFLLSATAVAVAAAGLTTVGASSASANGATVRVSTQGSAVTDAAGNTWSAGTGFTGGYQVPSVTSNDIRGTVDDRLYQSEHWGMSAWRAQVPNGTYDVTLKMAETYFGAKGARVFSVTAEGTRVVTDLDLFAVAGKDTAVDRTFRVTVADGSLDLGFSATRNHAKVGAVQVVPVTAGAVVQNPRPVSPSPAPAPVVPAPAPAPTPAPAPVPATAGPWKSGASGVGVASGAFGAWRGSQVGIAATWSDNNTAAANFWQLDRGAEYGSWTGDLDVAVGAFDRGESWSAAARGAYDARWRASLTTLRTKWGNRPGTVYIRFAHEMNGNWYPWSVNAGNAQDFVAAWKRYRALQKEVFPGAKLVFNVNRESVNSGVDWRKTFPGAQFVDVMGVDYYNQYPYAGDAATFASSLQQVDGFGAPKGLAQHLAFAKSVGLPLSVSEWSGNADNGDSPAFVQGMFDFFRANGGTGAGKLLYEVQFNCDIDGKRWLLTEGTRMPRSAAKYRELF